MQLARRNLRFTHPAREAAEGAEVVLTAMVRTPSKSDGEADVQYSTYYHLSGLGVTVLRYFNVYDPAGRPDSATNRYGDGHAAERIVKALREVL